jgi:hypothetical protein
VDKPSKELREALYRARASLAQVTHMCAEWGGKMHNQGALMGFQQIDRTCQDAVEDADKVLIAHEQVNIFDLWYCNVCHTYELPSDEEEPHCHFQAMHKVKVERIA